METSYVDSLQLPQQKHVDLIIRAEFRPERFPELCV